MGILIDTSVLIDHDRGGLDIEARIAGREDETVLLSLITVSELLHGVHRAPDRKQHVRRSISDEAVIDRFPLLPVDLATARAHAEIWALLAAEGRLWPG